MIKKITIERAMILAVVLALITMGAFSASNYTRFDQVYQKAPVVNLAAGANAVDTTPHVSGTVFAQGTTSAATVTLPDAASGLLYHFAVVKAGTVVVDPQASDRIFGLGSAAGDRVRNVGTVGDHLSIVGIGDATWAVLSEHGTWSDIN